jgi:hypothetical protein
MTTEERRLHRLARIRRRKELGPIPNRHPMTDLSNMTKEEKRLRINKMQRERGYKRGRKPGPLEGQRAAKTNRSNMTDEEKRIHRNILAMRRYHNGGQEKQLEAGRQWRKKAPEKKKALDRKGRLKQKYNLTIDDYKAMQTAQENRCGICQSTEKSSPRFKLWCVDHDEETGRIRGLLCHNCNAGIGLFKHNIERLEQAIQYLRSFPLKGE